jgi:hypothetical protein
MTLYCIICKEQIKFLQKYYEKQKIEQFDGATYYFMEYAHKDCIPKKKKKDGDDNTSNVVYT